jgi:hypothetical protein
MIRTVSKRSANRRLENAHFPPEKNQSAEYTDQPPGFLGKSITPSAMAIAFARYGEGFCGGR